MGKGFLKGALVGGLAGALCAAATVAVAGTGLHGVFNLGDTNTIDGYQTTLQGTHAGKLLQVTNSSTAAGATPLGLTAGAGRPPLAVNSSVKVDKLNADRLDNLDSTALQMRVAQSCAGGSAMKAIQASGVPVCGPGLQVDQRWRVGSISLASTFPTYTTLASLSLAPGTYAVLGRVHINGVVTYCRLIGPNASYSTELDAENSVGYNTGATGDNGLSLMGLTTSTARLQVNLECARSSSTVQATATRVQLLAFQVGGATRSVTS